MGGEGAAQHLLEPGGVEGLGHVLVGGGDDVQSVQGDKAGHDDAQGVGGGGARLFQQLAALHSGHEMVREDQVGRVGLDRLQGLERIGKAGDDGLRHYGGDDGDSGFEDLALVVNNINFSFHLSRP